MGQGGCVSSRHQPDTICQCDMLHHARAEQTGPNAYSCSVNGAEVKWPQKQDHLLGDSPSVI